MLLKSWDRMAKLWGLDAPKESVVTMTENSGEEVDNPEAMEFLAGLAAWARVNNAIYVRGYDPALPSWMTERPSGNGYAAGIGDMGMWSKVVEFPEDEED